MFTEQLSQFLSLPVQSLAAASRTAGNYTCGPANSNVIDMLKFKRVMAHVTRGIGALGTENVQAWFTVGNTNNSSDSTWAALAGGATITLTTNNSEATLEMRSDQLPAGARYAQLNVYAVATVNCSGAAFCGDSPYSPANQFDNSNTTQLVARTVV